MNDNVMHPSHYTDGGIEVIEYIRAKLSAEGFEGYCEGNVLKYMSRAGKKGDKVEDLKKASWYLNYLIDFLSETPPPTEPEPPAEKKPIDKAAAEALGKTKKSGAPRKETDDETIRKMYEDGMKPADIADVVGVSKQVVTDRLKEMGVYQTAKKIDDGKLKALYTANPPWPITKIADEMGISPQTVYNHLEKMGLYKKGGDTK